MKKNNDALFYTCSLIEFIGRATKNRREDVVQFIKDDIRRIYKCADVFSSWITEHIQNYNSDFYYQSRDYIAECYRSHEILPA